MNSIAKWGLTQVKANKFEYTWTIKNFSCLQREVGKELRSPSFLIENQNDTEWFLELYPGGLNDNNKDYLSFYLYLKPGKFNKEGHYILSILNTKKEKFLEKKREIDPSYRFWGIENFIKYEIITNPTNDLLINDSLTLHCEIIFNTEICHISNEKNEIMHKDSKLNGSYHFENLLFSEKFSDVKLVTACGREVLAHKNILATRSPVFSAMFEYEMLENKKNIVNIPDVDYDVLKEMLRFIYSAKIENVDNIASPLLVVADKYGIEDLKLVCAKVLCNNISVNNVIQILVLADRHSVENLKNQAIKFLKFHVSEVIDTDEFQSMQPSILIDIIKTLAN